MIYFPLSYEFENVETASENKSEFFKGLKDLTLPKIDTKTNKISKYTKKGNSKTCDFEVTNKFVSSDDTNLIDDCVSYNTYFFRIENKELKLVKKIELP